MHEAGALVVGATLAAARAVWTGEVEHAFNAAGGLHHAMPARASGFCVYDDPAVAIAWLLAQGAERIAYVDVDVHHGDGVQAIFCDDPRVLTVSIHEYAPEIGFFPGTGGLDERGGPGAEGSAVNVPLPPGTGRRRVARGVPHGDPGGGAAVPARRAGDPAGVRHARHRSAGAPAAHDPRLPRDGQGAARARARGRRRPMGGDRRRRLPVGARRAARVDDLLRRDGRRRDPRPAPRGVDRATEFLLRAEVPATISEAAGRRAAATRRCR